MQTARSTPPDRLGYHLLESILLPEETFNSLFAALFLTALGVFVGGNILLLDVSALRDSALVSLPCLTMLLIFYSLSRSTGSISWGLVLTLSLAFLVVYARASWLVPVVYALGFLSLIYLVRFLRVAKAQRVMVLLMAAIATATIMGAYGTWTAFDMPQHLHTGTIFQDSLFHASIAAMIKNYGVTSTGLHGLVETPYHILAHVQFASISLLADVAAIEVIGVATWVLFAPMLIFATVVCIAMLDQSGQVSAPIAWAVACVLLVLAPLLFQFWGIWNYYFVSESYLVSLNLLLLALPLLFKRQLSLMDLLLIPVITAMATSAKVSVGPILAGLWFVRILFIRGTRTKRDAAAFILSAAAAGWMALSIGSSNQETATILPLHFIRKYAFLGNYVTESLASLNKGTILSLRSISLALIGIVSFFVFHFLFTWISVTRVAHKKSISAVLSTPMSLYSLAAALAGALVVILFYIPGGSAFYISNIAFFVASPGIVAWLAHAFQRQSVSNTPLLLIGLLLICLLNVKGFYRASALHPSRASTERSAFIDALMEARDSTPLNVVLRPGQGLADSNPVAGCTGQMFVYPAVSERPWVDIITTEDGCGREHYLFGHYGLSEAQETVTIQPKLLPGMATITWPETAADSTGVD